MMQTLSEIPSRTVCVPGNRLCEASQSPMAHIRGRNLNVTTDPDGRVELLAREAVLTCRTPRNSIILVTRKGYTFGMYRLERYRIDAIRPLASPGL